MQTRTDAELLAEYAARGSETAFGEIVRRYADFVYTAALRQISDPDQARDVAQIVFTALARKAGSFRRDVVLIGWLCQAARVAALEHLRKDRRRLQRERQAVELHDPETPNDWSQIRPVLDEALSNLGGADRDALLLRFFKDESLSAVGAALGVSEDAAQKRVSRALEKLRVFLAGRGITASESALSGLLIANAAHTAPAGLATALTAKAVMSHGAMVSGGTFLKGFGVSQLKTSVALVALSAGVAGLLIANVRAHRDLREARTANAGLAGEIDALRVGADQWTAATNEIDRLRRDARDVLRLRAEAAQLRRQIAERTTPAAADAITNAPDAVAPQVHIRVRYLSLPAGDSPAFVDGAPVPPEFELKLLEQAKLESSEVEILGDSQVITLSGQSVQLKMIDQIPMGNPASPIGMAMTNVGFVFDVLPEYGRNSRVIDLKLAATITDILDSTDDGVPGPIVEGLTLSNRLAIADGKTAVMIGNLPEGGVLSRSKNGATRRERLRKKVLIFVEPTLMDSVGNRIAAEERDSPLQPLQPPGSDGQAQIGEPQ